MSNFSIRKLLDLQEVLMEPSAPGPREVYFVVRVQSKEFGLEPNITIIPPARIGQEFPKTYGHYHQNNESETYRVLYGQATLLVQKPENNEADKIEDVKILLGKVGDTLTVPEGYGHCLINATDDLLVTADWKQKQQVIPTNQSKICRGFAIM